MAPNTKKAMAPHSCILAWKIPWMDACWAQTEDPSGCGAASLSQGPWDPDSLRPALSLPLQQWDEEVFL